MHHHHRRVDSLRAAWLTPPRRQPRPATPKQREGLAYEHRCGEAMPFTRANVWYGFEDRNGPGFCAPDLIWVLPGEVIIFECKLTDRPEAMSQLLDLYIPIAAHVHGRPARGIVLTKHLTSFSAGVVGTLIDALAAKGIPVLHWLGTAPGLLLPIVVGSDAMRLDADLPTNPASPCDVSSL